MATTTGPIQTKPKAADPPKPVPAAPKQPAAPAAESKLPEHAADAAAAAIVLRGSEGFVIVGSPVSGRYPAIEVAVDEMLVDHVGPADRVQVFRAGDRHAVMHEARGERRVYLLDDPGELVHLFLQGELANNECRDAVWAAIPPMRL